MGGAGNGNVQIKGDTSGIILFDSSTTTSASLKDQADTQFSIIITGAVTFSVNFNAVGVCTATNCNFGVCSVDAANQPICACKPCYSDGVGADKKCSNYTDKCVTSGIFCGDTSYCVPTVNATTCGYYCNCPDWPTDCPYKPLDCESTTCEDDGGFDTKAFWKRDESFEDFDPYEFVQQAQEAETTLNFTMPESIIERDPYVLLADASNLTALANA
uniref:Uncharacterized protein n=1 Tax=Panagrolaimus superbus TaxID=310955 RepID=A0A914Y1G5_9BILA